MLRYIGIKMLKKEDYLFVCGTKGTILPTMTRPGIALKNNTGIVKE